MVDLAGRFSLLMSRQVEYVKHRFDLRNADHAFNFVFWLYNFVSLAIEDSHPSFNPSAIQEMNLPLLTRGDDDDDDDDDDNDDDDNDVGNGSPFKSDIVSDVAILAALKRAGYTIPKQPKGFESLLPVRVSFPRKSQRLTLPLSRTQRWTMLCRRMATTLSSNSLMNTKWEYCSISMPTNP